MRPHEFRRFLARLDSLTPAQLQDASHRMRDLRRKSEALAEIEAKADGGMGCPHCHHDEREKWGRTKTQVQRYRCLNCRRTFTGRTGSSIQHLHRPDLFLELVKDMLGSRAPSSIRELARRLNRNKHTIWRWRMIVLEALGGASSQSFAGIVEADETYQRESRKGSREWVRHLRDPSNHPKPPRLRWYEYGKKGVPMMRGLSRWQLPILTVADRSGARRFERIPDRTNRTIDRALTPLLAPDSVLCTDAHAGYIAFAQAHGIEHFTIRTKPGQKTLSASHHIQNVNSLHSRYDEFIKPFRGPASKHLDGYIQWFVARVSKITHAEAFQAT